MIVPILPSTRDAQLFIAGDVQLHTGATVASGVILQAEPGSVIVIENGACIGMGSVIHASGGSLIISEGAILGAGVLLFGAVSVGANSCIGAGSTVMDAAIAPGVMVPAHSLILSNQADIAPVAFSATSVEASIRAFSVNATVPYPSGAAGSAVPPAVAPPTSVPRASTATEVSDAGSDPWAEDLTPEPAIAPPSLNSEVGNPSPVDPQTPPQTGEPAAVPSAAEPIEVSSPVIPAEPRLGATAVYGKVKLNQLLITLMPHRQLNQTTSLPPLDED